MYLEIDASSDVDVFVRGGIDHGIRTGMKCILII